MSEPMNRWAIWVPHWRPPTLNEVVMGRHCARATAPRSRRATSCGATPSSPACRPRPAGAACRSRYAWARGKGGRTRTALTRCFFDAAVRAGILLDDDARGLAGRVEVAFVRDREAPGTLIVLEDVE